MTSDATIKSLYRADYFNRWPWLLHGVTSRNMVMDSRSRAENLKSLAAFFDLDNIHIVTAEQEHSNRVRVVSDLTFRKGGRHTSILEIPGVDALVTNLTDTMLVIRSADCVPLQIIDPHEHIIGVAHAGWKGTLGRILSNTLRELSRLGSRLENVYIHAGPHVCGKHYEVGDQRLDLFRQHFPETHGEFITGSRLDLARCNVLQAIEAGVPQANISICDLCTVHNNDTFYSYRANDFKQTGDNFTFLMIQRASSF